MVACNYVANAPKPPVVIVNRVQNRTEEHIDTVSMTDKIRTQLESKVIDTEDNIERIRKESGRYRKKYNEDPDAMVALGYDALKLLADAMKRAGTTDPAKVNEAIAATKDFPGVTGKITLDEHRNPTKPAVMLQVKNGKFAYVETIAP
jgi:branched-chain amino acid transport system substrate-binding protein